MQTNRRAVRFYIDRDADTPVVRSVPVARPSVAAVASPDAPAARSHGDDSAMAFAAAESRRRRARHLLTSLRIPRRHAS